MNREVVMTQKRTRDDEVSEGTQGEDMSKARTEQDGVITNHKAAGLFVCCYGGCGRVGVLYIYR